MLWEFCTDCALSDPVGRLNSVFCSTPERAGDQLRSREEHSSANSQHGSKRTKMLLHWLARKRFHPWKKWECMSEPFCWGLRRGIQHFLLKGFPFCWRVLTEQCGRFRGSWPHPDSRYWFHKREKVAVRHEGSALCGGVNGTGLGFWSFLLHTQCLSASLNQA